jgi:hypothetical protein
LPKALTRPPALFAASAALVVAACVAVLRSHAFGASPYLAAWGVTFDLTISIPALYWLLLVRTGRVRPLTLAPVFLLGVLLASTLVPRTNQQFLRDLGRFAVPAVELVLLGAIVRRLMRLRGASVDIPTAVRALFGESRIADVVTSEVSMVWYALFCWRRKPQAVEGRAITFHQRSGWGTIVACLLVLLAAESVGMHLLLRLWSNTAAWVWTGLDLWGAIWLIGDYHALRLRRSSIDEHALRIRFGMRWSLDVPLANIASVTEVREESEWKRRDVLKLAILDEPRWLVTLREPMVAQGMAGIRKRVTAIAMLPDCGGQAILPVLSRRDRQDCLSSA